MVKQFTYKGKTLEELKLMSIKEFTKLIPSRQRRSLLREPTKYQKTLMKKVEKANNQQYKKQIKTHAKDTIIIPSMVGLTIYVHNGKEFTPVIIIDEMISHVLGEFVLTRQNVKHSAPGIGATRSSAHQSVK